jgi:CheY-like chemotaxis protein
MMLLIFDDEYEDEVNVLFLKNIKIFFPKIKIRDPARVQLVESILNSNSFDIIILDIMSQELNLRSLENNELVKRKFVGIELLKRIRSGFYKMQNRDVPIIMRTARATEPEIKSLCIQYGANDCIPPSEDDSIIDMIRTYYDKYYQN